MKTAKLYLLFLAFILSFQQMIYAQPSTSVPSLSAPFNGSTWETTTPTLIWWMTGTNSTTVFNVLVSTSPVDFNNTLWQETVTGVTGCSIPASANFVAGQTYYWKVVFNGNSSVIWRFTPKSGTIHSGVPRLSAPINNSDWETVTPMLTWWMTGSSESSVYSISISTSQTNFINPDFLYRHTVTGVTSFQIPEGAGLISGMDYYWKIVSASGESEVWHFRTGWQTVLPQFTSLGLRKSVDNIIWSSADGDLSTGFSTELLPLSSPDAYYYLDVTSGSSTNIALQPGYYGFTITSHPAELFTYFAAKGVNASAVPGTWQNVAYKIITGELPTFYLGTASDGSMQLVDGLLHYLNAGDNSRLRINPDYPTGTYTYSGNITGINGETSGLITVSLTLRSNTPQFTSLNLKKSSDQVNWSAVDGNIQSGFSTELLPLNNLNDYYYFEIASGTSVNTPLAPGDYPFYVTNHPAELDGYFALKGVDASSDQPWEQLLYSIITGTQPTFYIHVADDGSYTLVDGFLYLLNGTYNRLRINPDYPIGEYTYIGTVTGINGRESDLISVNLSILRKTPQFIYLGMKKSSDQTIWQAVNGNINAGFSTELMPLTNPNDFYYLDIASGAAVNTPLAPGYYPFTIIQHPEGLDAYFAAKGVDNTPEELWQGVVYNIINGELPTFFIRVSPDGSLSLVDGMLHHIYPEGTNEYNGRLRINYDYPSGIYTYRGTVTGLNGAVSAPITVNLTIQRTVPIFTLLQLTQSSDEMNWTAVSGNLASGFTAELLPLPGDFYYLNTASVSTNTPLAPGYYPFTITAHPQEMDAYFAAKGVDNTPDYPWQAVLYNIINGSAPTFYIKVASNGSMKLVDGLQHTLYPPADPLYDAYLRINDDYPAGVYTYTGVVTGANGVISGPVNVSLTVLHTSNAKVLSIGSAFSNRGATVCIPAGLTLSGNSSIDRFMMGSFTYDPSKLKFKRITAGSGTLINEHSWSVMGYQLSENQIGVACSGFDPIRENGVLFNIYFDVIGTTAGIADISSGANDWLLDIGDTFSNIEDGMISYSVPAGPSSLRGDADLNFNVNYDDALAIINHLYFPEDELWGAGLVNADADMSGTVDFNDAMAVIYYTSFGNWTYSAPILVPAAFDFNPNYESGNSVIRIPIELNNSDEINCFSIKLKYDQNIFDYHSLKFSSVDQSVIHGSEIRSGEAQLTYLSVNPGNSSLKLGELILKLKEGRLYTGEKIQTEYSIHGSEYITGPDIELNITGLGDIAEDIIPDNFIVLQNYPNPFNPSTTISFGLPQNEFVTLKIYNSLGCEIRTLLNDEKKAGFHSMQWNGRDDFNNPVASGIYIYQVNAGKSRSSSKMILLK